MAAIIVLLVGAWVVWLLYGSAEKRREMLDEIATRSAERQSRPAAPEPKSAPKKQDTDSEDDELFNTDLGDF